MKRKNIIGSRMNFQYQFLSQHGRQDLKNVNLTIYISATTGQICCDWAWWWDCFANFCSYKVTINIQPFIGWPSLYLRSAQGSKWQYKILNNNDFILSWGCHQPPSVPAFRTCGLFVVFNTLLQANTQCETSVVRVARSFLAFLWLHLRTIKEWNTLYEHRDDPLVTSPERNLSYLT